MKNISSSSPSESVPTWLEKVNNVKLFKGQRLEIRAKSSECGIQTLDSSLEGLASRTYHTQSVLSAAQKSCQLFSPKARETLHLLKGCHQYKKQIKICHNKPVQIVVKGHTPPKKFHRERKVLVCFEECQHTKTAFSKALLCFEGCQHTGTTQKVSQGT